MLAARTCSLAAVIGTAILLACTDASAKEPKEAGRDSAASGASSPADEEDEPKQPLFSYGAGVLGFIGANFLDKPSNRMVTLSDGREAEAPDVYYPGYGGVSAGGGLMLEGRVLGFIGMELDLFRSSDRGHGDATINGYKSTIDVGQSSWHLPLLFKATVPMPVVRPSIFVGPEFVFPGDAAADVAHPIPGYPQVTASASSYTMVTAGLGFEFKLPIPKVDIRIPLQLRGSYHSVPDRLGDRADFTLDPSLHVTKMNIHTEWKWQTQAVLGVSIWF
jgi:hypothetical protein